MTWQVAAFALVTLALLAGFGWYERSSPNAKMVAAVAVLAALTALGRIAFSPVPNVTPTTDLVFIAGYAFGGAPGFAVGAIAALTSNILLGQGPWTPWQMVGWGSVGLIGALVARGAGPRLGRAPLAACCAVCGLYFGALMDVYQTAVTTDGVPTLTRYLAVSATSLPFNVAHVIGNVAFALAFGPLLIRTLTRFRARFTVKWRPLLAGSSAGLLALVLLLAAVSQPARAVAISKSVEYLERTQNRDGGFGGTPGQSSNQLHTGWVALGLLSAGRNPAAVKRGSKSVIEYIRKNEAQLNDVGELERTVLILSAARLDPRNFAGRDFVGELLAQRAADGSIGKFVNATAFAACALRAAGYARNSAEITGAAKWLVTQQNSDGGFSFAKKGGASDSDVTAAVVQGLVAAGYKDSQAVKRSISYLRRAQNPDGGFPLSKGAPSNSQSTAWVVQALVASGRNPGPFGKRSPIGYLRGLIDSDGSVRYSPQSGQTPVWVTSQAVMALERRSFPLRPLAVARDSRISGAVREGTVELTLVSLLARSLRALLQ